MLACAETRCSTSPGGKATVLFLKFVYNFATAWKDHTDKKSHQIVVDDRSVNEGIDIEEQAETMGVEERVNKNKEKSYREEGHTTSTVDS